MDPVLEDHQTGTGREYNIDPAMVMSEYEIVHFILSRKFHGKSIQRLLFASKLIFYIVSKTIILRPSVPEPERKPRMQGAEQGLRQTVMKKSSEEAIS